MTVQFFGRVAMVDGAIENTVSVWDAGFTVGDGIFETVAVRAGRAVAIQAHLDRLERAARSLGFRWPAREVWLHDVAALFAAGQADETTEAILRLQLTSGPYGQGTTRVLTLRPLGPRELTRRMGLKLHVVASARGVEGGLGAFKTTSWIASAVARRTHPEGEDPAFEGLFVSAAGEVLEGTTTAIGARFGRSITFPPLDGRILESTARARLVEIIGQLGLEIYIAPLPITELANADEVIALNALLPVTRCLTLDGVPLPAGDLVSRLLPLLTGD